MHGGDFHLRGDGGRTSVQGTTEDVGEAQDVVDLVRVVGATGGHDRVRAHLQHFFGQDFRCGVGQRQDERLGRHFLHHLGLQHAARRQAQKHIGAVNHFRQSAHIGFLHELDFVFVHQLGAAFINHACQVGDPDVFVRHAQLHQHAQTRQGCGPRARGDQLDLGDVFAHHFQAIQDGRTDHDGGAVLVVMEDRNLHALAQLALDIKTIGRFDVFEVDAAKGGLERGDDVDQFVRVFLVHLDVKHIDASELFEQHALAFHDRFGSQWTNVAQAQHGGAVGDDGHQIAPAGVLVGVVRVLDDFFARRGHTGRISQR